MTSFQLLYLCFLPWPWNFCKYWNLILFLKYRKWYTTIRNQIPGSFYIECVEITISNINSFFISYISRVSAGVAIQFFSCSSIFLFYRKVIVNIPYGVIFPEKTYARDFPPSWPGYHGRSIVSILSFQLAVSITPPMF
jgi:hypothetical protein